MSERLDQPGQPWRRLRRSDTIRRMSCVERASAFIGEAVQETNNGALLCVNREGGMDPERFWVQLARIDDHSPVKSKGDRGLLLVDADATITFASKPTSPGIKASEVSERTFPHIDGWVCSRDGNTPEPGDEEAFLESGLCGWCSQVEDHA